jgi:anhydro-N-acetylmuramic acid kinase
MGQALYIGLMSGTSLDGIDAVLADFSAAAPLLKTSYRRFDDDLRRNLGALRAPGDDELDRAAMASNRLAQAYADSVRALIEAAGTPPQAIAAIGCHGQTVRHHPERGYTTQLVNAALLAELTGFSVACDFRSRDVAAGSQGAPLVPAFHAAFFRHPDLNRVIVNLGGIANLTWLPATGSILGFDCGPANALLDDWAALHLGERYDAAGRWAAGGRVLGDLLRRLESDPYFTQSPPKSTGRHYFSLEWVHAHLGRGEDPQDVQATLAELTATTLARASGSACGQAQEVYLCGGGVANADLVARLGRALGSRAVGTTAQLGVDPDFVEALAFAWLARETLAGRPGNLPEVTGARGLRVLGCHYPA